MGTARQIVRELARAERRNSTHAERVLWEFLRGRRLGMKFRRQHPVGPFILDFFCVEHRLAVELDGDQHVSEADAERDAILGRAGIRVLRFESSVALGDPARITRAILRVVETTDSGPLSRLRERGSGGAGFTVEGSAVLPAVRSAAFPENGEPPSQGLLANE